jgi:hypothetical protein
LRVIVPQAKDEPETTMEIIGLVGDAAYYSVREPMRPTVYVPIESRGGHRSSFEPQASRWRWPRLSAGRSPGRDPICACAVGPQTAHVRQQMRPPPALRATRIDPAETLRTE